MATKKRSSKSNAKMRNSISLILVLLLIFAVNYFMGDPLGLLPEPDPAAAAPTATASLENTPNQGGAQAAAGQSLEVFVLDVGQGDSIFLRSPNGKTMLIDASEKSEIYKRIDSFLQEQNVTKLDVVIATHPHADHIGNMQKIVENYEIGTYYMTDAMNTTKMFERLLAALDERDVNVQQCVGGENSFIEWDELVEIRVLSPLQGFRYSDLNDSSIICRVKYGDTAMIFTGDAEIPAEKIMLGALPGSYFKANVLKLGHHGSSTSTGEALLAAVDPDIAVASVGEDNDYNHPNEETLDALKNAGIPLYRTDLSGIVHFIFDGKKVTVETEK